MALPTHWRPLGQLSRFDPMTDFEDLFRTFGVRPLAREYQHTLEMRMDVTETDKAYRVTIDMPGIKKEDIDVSVEGNQVSVSAEVKREQSSDNEKEVYSERYTGKAYRAFTLPSEVDSSGAEARYDGGVLILTLPKKVGTGSKHLPIN